MVGGFKNLTESYAYSLRERDTYFDLWRTEQAARKKDRADHQVIIDSYSGIQTIDRMEITGYKIQIRKEVRKGRVSLVIAVGAAAAAIYFAVK